jgi:hypothetical protein
MGIRYKAVHVTRPAPRFSVRAAQCTPPSLTEVLPAETYFLDREGPASGKSRGPSFRSAALAGFGLRQMLCHSGLLSVSVAAVAFMASVAESLATVEGLTRQCAAPVIGRCPTPVPRSSYANSDGLLTAAECCAQCVADGSLCFGWTWSAAGPDAESSKPGGGSCNQFDAPLSVTNLQPWNCTFGLNARDPPKPLPVAPKISPPGAKNVLFLVADGACCPNLPHILWRQLY